MIVYDSCSEIHVLIAMKSRGRDWDCFTSYIRKVVLLRVRGVVGSLVIT